MIISRSPAFHLGCHVNADSLSRLLAEGFARPSLRPVNLSPGCDLTIEQLVAVARGDGGGHYAEVRLDGHWRERCQRSSDYVSRSVDETMGKSRDELANLARQRAPAPPVAGVIDDARRALIYGVTTGFGTFKSRPLDSRDAAEAMQLNLLRSHATGVGAPMPIEVVRAMMLLRVRTFIEGHSAVRPALVEWILELLNRGVHPFVPEKGSVGSSGDLCPLAHLALVVVGEGLAWMGNPSISGPVPGMAEARLPDPRPAREVLQAAGLADRVLSSLAPKEGLALTNGTAAATAYAALAAYDAAALYGSANLGASVTLQALCGATRAYDPKVHALRRHDSQCHAAAQILRFVTGSRLVNSSGEVQEAYSLRCAPAVHGAALHAIRHAWDVIENELNAVTDNPLFFDGDTDGPPCDAYAACIWDAYTAGNFHGEPVGMVADYLKIAVAELASISERRTQALLDGQHNHGLPANLWPDPATAGLNSGLMIAQYAAAALVSENKVLAHPASVDSIPTSSNIEDHVAMSTIAARHARHVVDNARHVLAVELLAATQALEIRCRSAITTGAASAGSDGLELASPPARALHSFVRRSLGIGFLHGADRELWPDIATVARAIHAGELLRAAHRPGD